MILINLFTEIESQMQDQPYGYQRRVKDKLGLTNTLYYT